MWYETIGTVFSLILTSKKFNFCSFLENLLRLVTRRQTQKRHIPLKLCKNNLLVNAIQLFNYEYKREPNHISFIKFWQNDLYGMRKYQVFDWQPYLFYIRAASQTTLLMTYARGLYSFFVRVMTEKKTVRSSNHTSPLFGCQKVSKDIVRFQRQHLARWKPPGALNQYNWECNKLYFVMIGTIFTIFHIRKWRWFINPSYEGAAWTGYQSYSSHYSCNRKENYTAL